ncbi:hypothetical protein Aperf_G00000107067 [Anoplocephala perfoliata]
MEDKTESQEIQDEVQPSSSHKREQLPQPKLPVPLSVFRLMFIGGVFLYSSYTIIIHLCEIDGKVPFSNAACVLLIEVFKLVLSVGMFLGEVVHEQRRMARLTGFFECLRNRLKREFSVEGGERGPFRARFFWIIAPFSVPAIMYTVTNNLGIIIQMEMDPATYQVLGNLKIFSTAILFRIIIKRPISKRQWFALFLLVVAGVINGCANFDTSSSNSSSVIHVTLKGLILIIIYCTVSGFASVYTEYVLKDRVQMSLNIQNATLYVFGILINGALYIFQEAAITGDFNLLRGFTFLTWVLVVTQGITGIFIGFVMKYSSSILRLFLISSATIATAILSVLIFNLVLKASFLVSACVVICALALYYL